MTRAAPTDRKAVRRKRAAEEAADNSEVRQNGRNVVALPRQREAATQILTDEARRIAISSARHVSESYRSAPEDYLPEPTAQLMAGFDEAIREIESSLEPAELDDVLKAIYLIAERKGLRLPPDHLVALDAQFIAEMPKDLFGVAFKKIYTEFRWNRMPEVVEWFDTIRDELDRRKRELAGLKCMRLRLEAKSKRGAPNGTSAQTPHASGNRSEREAHGPRHIASFLPAASR